MNDTNKTVLTDEQIKELCRDFGMTKWQVKAVLAKLPGMPAEEWIDKLERLVVVHGGVRHDAGVSAGLGNTPDDSLRQAAFAEIMAHARQRIQPAAKLDQSLPWHIPVQHWDESEKAKLAAAKPEGGDHE